MKQNSEIILSEEEKQWAKGVLEHYINFKIRAGTMILSRSGNGLNSSNRVQTMLKHIEKDIQRKQGEKESANQKDSKENECTEERSENCTSKNEDWNRKGFLKRANSQNTTISSLLRERKEAKEMNRKKEEERTQQDVLERGVIKLQALVRARKARRLFLARCMFCHFTVYIRNDLCSLSFSSCYPPSDTLCCHSTKCPLQRERGT